MEQAGLREAAQRLALALEDRLAPVAQLLPGQRVDVRALRQILQGLLARSHDIGRLHPGDVVQIVLAAQQAGLQEGRGEVAVGRQVLGQVDHVGHGVDTLQGREGAVQRADHIHRAAAGLRLGRHQVQQRAFLGAGHVEACLLQDGAESLLLLDRHELGREEGDIHRLRHQRRGWRLHLAGAIRRRVRGPAGCAGLVHQRLQVGGLLGQHIGDLLAVEHHPVEGVAEDLVDLAAARAQAHRQQRRQRVSRVGLRADGRGLDGDAGRQVRRVDAAHHREEAHLLEDAALDLRRRQVVDGLHGRLGVGCGLGDAQADDHRHEAAAGRPGRRREAHELVRLLVEGVEQARRVVEGDPHLAGQQRLLHEAVVDRLRVDVGPQLIAQPLQHGRSLVALEVADHAAGEGRPHVALQEAMEQAGLREAAQRLSLALVDRLAPIGKLLPGQVVQVGAGRQVLQRVLVRAHDVGGLHPGHVIEVVVAAQQAGLQEGLGEVAAGRQVLGRVDHVSHGVDPLQGREGAVQRADQVDGAAAGLRLGRHQVQQRALLGAGEVEAAVGQDRAELLGLLDWHELGREEDQAAHVDRGRLDGRWRSRGRRSGGGGFRRGGRRRGGRRRGGGGRAAAGGDQQGQHDER